MPLAPPNVTAIIAKILIIIKKKTILHTLLLHITITFLKVVVIVPIIIITFLYFKEYCTFYFKPAVL